MNIFKVGNFVSFDIETAKLAPEDDDGNWDLGITCAAAAWFDEHSIVQSWVPAIVGDDDLSPYAPAMSPVEAWGFAQWLIAKELEGFTIVGWNSMGFDFRVLAEAVRCGYDLVSLDRAKIVAELALRHTDPAFLMLCQKGYMVGLDAIAEANDLTGKMEGMDGLRAVEMWGEGREAQDEVVRYVEQDAVATATVYEFLCGRSDVHWITSKGFRSRAYWWPRCTRDKATETVTMWNVTEAVGIKAPDTSWMDSPWPRSRFRGWTAAIPDAPPIDEDDVLPGPVNALGEHEPVLDDYTSHNISVAVQPPLEEALAQAVANLAKARAQETDVKLYLEKLELEFVETEYSKALENARKGIRNAHEFVDVFDTSVRDLAVRLGARDGTKKPHPAITIKEYTGVVIVDEYEALKFLRQHIQQCVKIDVRETKKLVKGGLVVPGVIFEKEFRATVARDLSKWLVQETLADTRDQQIDMVVDDTLQTLEEIDPDAQDE